MSKPGLTSSQTVGPFFSSCLLCEGACRNVLTQPETRGERIRIEGRVIDGDGLPVPDSMVEIWQANADAATITARIKDRLHLIQHLQALGVRELMSKDTTGLRRSGRALFALMPHACRLPIFV